MCSPLVCPANQPLKNGKNLAEVRDFDALIHTTVPVVLDFVAKVSEYLGEDVRQESNEGGTLGGGRSLDWLLKIWTPRQHCAVTRWERLVCV